MEKGNTEKIWVFCFEYAGIAKVGGLGEVSSNQCRCLSSEDELDLQVFMPSHNRQERLKESHGFSPLRKKNGDILVLKGHFDPSYFGLTFGDQIHSRTFTKFQSITEIGYFEVEIWQGIFKGTSINLLVGKNGIAKKILNDPDVYGADTLNAKLGLFSQSMKEYMRYCIYEDKEKIPEIIHIHDHHPLGALLCCKQELLLKGMNIKSIITMHLLTWPRRELDFYWKSGVNNEPIDVQLGDFRVQKRIREIYEIAKDSESIAPTLEKVGCLVADKVVAVSENFLHSDIIPNCGGDMIEPKTDFTWNGCDWDFEEHLDIVWDGVKDHFPEKNKEEIASYDLRKQFLTNILGNLPEEEPIIKNDNIKSMIREEFQDPPYHPDCTVDPFKEDGPLVLITGRVTPQKGIENILDSIPQVREKIPNVKFLFLMIPGEYTMDDLRYYMQEARKYPENVRFLFGIAKSIYLLAHHSADVYCCPSRWEPFGIVALEAMASKIPVVATYVGGLQESILHLEDHPQKGTGLLCPKDDVGALKNALISLLSTMKIAELKTKNSESMEKFLKDFLTNVVHPNLRKKVEENHLFGKIIRDNCLERVETTFRWEKVSQKLKEIYLNLK